MSTDPNWRQFAREVVWTVPVSNACRLLDVTIPPEGRPRRFHCAGITIERKSDGEPFICWQGGAGSGVTRQVATGDDVLAFLAPSPSAGAHNMALREWLAMWGWVPPPRKAAVAPPPPPPIL
jgi:hypothetical protein